MCSKEAGNVKGPESLEPFLTRSQVTEQATNVNGKLKKEDSTCDIVTVGKDILGEADAAAIAACLVTNESHAEDALDKGISEPEAGNAGNVSMEAEDDLVEEKVEEGTNSAPRSGGGKKREKRNTFTSKSIMTVGMKRKLAMERSGTKSQAAVEEDPTYVVDDSSESSDEYQEPIKRRLRRAPKRRHVGVIDTFTQHLEKRRTRRTRKPREEVVCSTESSPPTVASVSGQVSKKFILNDETSVLTREQLLKLKEKNIEHLKDLIRQQEQAMEEIKKGKTSLDEPIKIVINSAPVTSKKEAQQTKASTTSVRSPPLLLPKVVTVVPNGIKLPVCSGALNPSITSLQVSPGSNIVKLVTYCPPGQTNTVTNTSASRKPLVIRGTQQKAKVAANVIHHGADAPVAADVAAGRIVSNAKRIAVSPGLIRGPGGPILANPLTAARPRLAMSSISSPVSNASVNLPASTSVNMSLVRLPAGTQSPGNIPGVFVNVQLPNSTGQQLVFVPSPATPSVAGVRPQTVLTPSVGTAVVPNVVQAPVGVTGNNTQIMVLPMQQAANGINLQRPLFVKQSVVSNLMPTTTNTLPLMTHTILPSPIKPNSSAGKPSMDHTKPMTSTSIASKFNSSNKVNYRISSSSTTEKALNKPVGDTNISGPVDSQNQKMITVADETITGMAELDMGHLKNSSSKAEKPCTSNGRSGLAITSEYKEKARARLDELLREQQDETTGPGPKQTDSSSERKNLKSADSEIPSLLHAKEVLKNALTAKKSVQSSTEKRQQSDNLSVLKNALKSAFASDALKPLKPTLIEDPKRDPATAGGSQAAQDTKPDDPLTPVKSLDSSTVVMSSSQTSSSVLYKNFNSTIKVETQEVLSPFAIGSIPRISNVTGVAQVAESAKTLPHAKPNIVLGQNIKTKILSHNGQYIDTSLPNLGLVNTISTTNGKQVSPVLVNKKNPQQLSGILVKLKDGGVRFVKFADAAKLKSTTEDEVRLLLGSAKSEIATATTPLSSLPALNMTVIPPLVPHILPQGCQTDERQMCPISTSLRPSTQLSTPVIPIAPKPSEVVNVSLASPEDSKRLSCDNLPALRNISDICTTTVAVLNTRPSSSVSVASDLSITPATISLHARTEGAHQKVGITLGKQEKLIQLENKAKETKTFFPCADDMDFTCLTGLETVVDLIQERTDGHHGT